MSEEQVHTTMSARAGYTESGYAEVPAAGVAEAKSARPGSPPQQVMRMPDYPHGRGGMAAQPIPAEGGTAEAEGAATRTTAGSETGRGMPPAQEMPPFPS